MAHDRVLNICMTECNTKKVKYNTTGRRVIKKENINVETKRKREHIYFWRLEREMRKAIRKEITFKMYSEK